MGGAGTVRVAVVVAVTGSVAGGGGVGAVEDDGDVAVAAVVVETVDFGEHRAPERPARITKRWCRLRGDMQRRHISMATSRDVSYVASDVMMTRVVVKESFG